jgi:dTMP kinase
MTKKKFYHYPPPGVDAPNLRGMLIVIEGMDSSGRSTHMDKIAPWIEEKGYAVARVGLKRSQLVGEALDAAKQGNVLSSQTMALFYATDFYDQLENRILPALRAGYVVLADRYIYTLMARDIVRGVEYDWVKSLYSMAVIPEAVYYLNVSWRVRVDRTLSAHHKLDYWESGMDIGLARDWFDSFAIYQRLMSTQFRRIQKEYGFEIINANRSQQEIERDLKTRIGALLERYYKHDIKAT